MAYATISELQQRYPSLANQSIDQQEAELDGATEWIDGHCARSFTVAASTSVRYFAATDPYCLDLGAFELGTSASVVVATDDGSGNYATTLSTYQLEPVNAPNVAVPRPFTSIRALGTTWPMAHTPNSLQERVKVTGLFGWPAVPESVKRACLTLAAAAFENPTGARSESIDGYSVTYTSASGGNVTVPDSVVALLGNFRRGWAA